MSSSDAAIQAATVHPDPLADAWWLEVILRLWLWVDRR
jgi:hypothetical protein